MDKIINLDHVRVGRKMNADNQPDPQFVKTDEYGRKMFCFMIEYEFKDATYGLDLWCYSMEEAQAATIAIRKSAVVVGQKMGEMPL